MRPLFPIPTLHERIRAWREVTGLEVGLAVGDLTDYGFVEAIVRDQRPTPSSTTANSRRPRSMIDVRHATYTQANNVIGNLNVLFAIRDASPETTSSSSAPWASTGPRHRHRGGVPDGRPQRPAAHLPLPKTPGSMYHLSKVHDSHNIHFACRIWGLRATDLNQGVVYGVEPMSRRSTRVSRPASTTTRSSAPRSIGSASRRPSATRSRCTARAGRPRLSEHPRHCRLHRPGDRDAGGSRQAARLQPVHRAVQRPRARRAGAGGRRAPRLDRDDRAHGQPADRDGAALLQRPERASSDSGSSLGC